MKIHRIDVWWDLQISKYSVVQSCSNRGSSTRMIHMRKIFVGTLQRRNTTVRLPRNFENSDASRDLQRARDTAVDSSLPQSNETSDRSSKIKQIVATIASLFRRSPRNVETSYRRPKKILNSEGCCHRGVRSYRNIKHRIKAPRN